MKRTILGTIIGIIGGFCMFVALFVAGALWSAKDAKLASCLRHAVLVRAKAEGLIAAQILHRDDDARCPEGARCYSIGGMTSNGRYEVRTFWAKVNKRSA